MNKIVKTSQSIDHSFSWEIISQEPLDLSLFIIDNVSYVHYLDLETSCINCHQEGQYKRQSSDKLRLEFYCPNCHSLWTVIRKEITT